jgi:hypothetical protein
MLEFCAAEAERPSFRGRIGGAADACSESSLRRPDPPDTGAVVPGVHGHAL